MQLGAREGGLSLIVKILDLSAPGLGIFTSLYTRVRELVWIFIGVGLVKIGNKKSCTTKDIFTLMQTFLFDYGGTLDTSAIHWYYIFKQAYAKILSPRI